MFISLSEPSMDKMFSKFVADPNILWLNVDEVYEMSAKNHPTPLTADQYSDLWLDLETNGMRTPLVITMSPKTRMMRLDSGNHRIRLFKLHEVGKVPCILEVVKNQVNSPANGTHPGIK